MPTEHEQVLIKEFLSVPFGDMQVSKIMNDEREIIKSVLNMISEQFKRKKYILGQGLNFTILAQKLSQEDEEMKVFTPGIELEDIFNKYTLVTSKGKTTANTLTLKYEGREEGIRKIEESVTNLFHSMNRSDYPSAYVYNTGQWKKFQDLMLLCFRLSENAKLILVNELILFGLSNMAENNFYIREIPRIRIFEEVLKSYARCAKNENGGLVLQAIAYGYLTADRPHLSIVADKVRTGSSRQKRFGDIDCYFGMDLELSVEVKDFEVTEKNFDKELSEFCRNCNGNSVVGIAFLSDVSETAATLILRYGVKIITDHVAIQHIEYWDWRKQDTALQGMLHYISHIEQNPNAVTRLLEFISYWDPTHDSLVYKKW